MLRGVQHGALVKQYRGIEQEERHNYLYNKSEMVDSHYHYDEKVVSFYHSRHISTNESYLIFMS